MLDANFYFHLASLGGATSVACLLGPESLTCKMQKSPAPHRASFSHLNTGDTTEAARLMLFIHVALCHALNSSAVIPSSSTPL